ncbi:hypothetical protein [Sphaerotilus mobilis]|uniref:Uncharacterized protein n=1 Tax=Sphaerotilus mobilis TaxID=47994 RepID=A0A4Q7LUD1_9BURK|nr:hypothetical protein [Sphaerotilus mobilis]RZS57963.1 hypothetical protein EV685_0237 [Sphaerotilus mobilis]
MRTQILHATPAYELSAQLQSTPHGHHLQFVSFVPTARRPEPQVRFQTLLSRTELLALRALIDAQLQVIVPAETGA